MFERFTEEARRVIVLAQKECPLHNDPHIGAKHLLLGLSQACNSTQDALHDACFDDSARQQFEAATPAPSAVTKGHIPFTPQAKRTLEESLHVAERLGQAHVAPHLLRAVLGVRDGGGRTTF